MEAKELGDFIAKIRKENQLTQAELAKRLNVTDKAVSRWAVSYTHLDVYKRQLPKFLGMTI